MYGTFGLVWQNKSYKQSKMVLHMSEHRWSCSLPVGYT